MTGRNSVCNKGRQIYISETILKIIPTAHFLLLYALYTSIASLLRKFVKMCTVLRVAILLHSCMLASAERNHYIILW